MSSVFNLEDIMGYKYWLLGLAFVVCLLIAGNLLIVMDKNKYAVSLFVVGMLFAFIAPITFISSNRYLVITNTSNYHVIRPGITLLNPLKIARAEKIESVPGIINEEEFITPTTNSFHFIKFKVTSKLRIKEYSDYQIFVASRHSPSVKGVVEKYIVQLIKGGEEDKEEIAKKTLAYFRKNPPGPWVPTEIKILSLKKIDG